MKKSISPSQLFGLGLSFGVTMFVSVWITTKIGGWLDGKLGLNGVCSFIGLLLGIFSGFRLLLENVAALEREKEWQNDKEDE